MSDRNFMLVAGILSLTIPSIAFAGWELRLEGQPGGYSALPPDDTLVNQPLSEDERVTVYLNGSVLPEKKTKAQILAEFPSLDPRALDFIFFKPAEAVSNGNPKLSSIEQITRNYLESFHVDGFKFYGPDDFPDVNGPGRMNTEIYVEQLKKSVKKSLDHFKANPGSLETMRLEYSKETRFVGKFGVFISYFGLERVEVIDLMRKGRSYLTNMNPVNSGKLFRFIGLFNSVLKDFGVEALTDDLIQDFDGTRIREFGEQKPATPRRTGSKAFGVSSPTGNTTLSIVAQRIRARHGLKRSFEEVDNTTGTNNQVEYPSEKRRKVTQGETVAPVHEYFSTETSSDSNPSVQNEFDLSGGELDESDWIEILGNSQPAWLTEDFCPLNLQ